MKKLLMIVAASLLSLGAMAQSRPGIIVSASYMGANVKSNEENVGNALKSGFRAGVGVDINLVNFDSGSFTLRPGLYYAAKGTKSESTLLKTSLTTTYGYVELPVLANLNFGLSDDFSVFVNAGPYVAYGVHSNVKLKAENGVIDEVGKKLVDSKKNAFKKNEDGKSLLNPLDAGIQIGAGVEFHNVMVEVGTQFGLVNMSNTDKIKSTNSTFFVGLGYRF